MRSASCPSRHLAESLSEVKCDLPLHVAVCDDCFAAAAENTSNTVGDDECRRPDLPIAACAEHMSGTNQPRSGSCKAALKAKATQSTSAYCPGKPDRRCRCQSQEPPAGLGQLKQSLWVIMGKVSIISFTLNLGQQKPSLVAEPP